MVFHSLLAFVSSTLRFIVDLPFALRSSPFLAFAGVFLVVAAGAAITSASAGGGGGGSAHGAGRGRRQGSAKK